MDIIVLEDWKHVVEVEDGEETTAGPYNKWDCVVLHPVELRQYFIDLKKVNTHYRMRVFYRDIRSGHRWMKAIHAGDVGEAQFIAMKHVNRYFEEQLALYNAVCVIHMGRKYSDICDCDDCDHSQHLYSEQQPLVAYSGVSVPLRKAQVQESGDICDLCAGKIDLEAYLKHNLCPYCNVALPKSLEEYEAVMGKLAEDYAEEYKALKGLTGGDTPPKPDQV